MMFRALLLLYSLIIIGQCAAQISYPPKGALLKNTSLPLCTRKPELECPINYRDKLFRECCASDPEIAAIPDCLTTCSYTERSGSLQKHIGKVLNRCGNRLLNKVFACSTDDPEKSVACCDGRLRLADEGNLRQPIKAKISHRNGTKTEVSCVALCTGGYEGFDKDYERRFPNPKESPCYDMRSHISSCLREFKYCNTSEPPVQCECEGGNDCMPLEWKSKITNESREMQGMTEADINSFETMDGVDTMKFNGSAGVENGEEGKTTQGKRAKERSKKKENEQSGKDGNAEQKNGKEEQKNKNNKRNGEKEGKNKKEKEQTKKMAQEDTENAATLDGKGKGSEGSKECNESTGGLDSEKSHPDFQGDWQNGLHPQMPDYHLGGDWGSGSGGGEWPDYHHGGDWGSGSGGGEWPDYHHGGDWGSGSGGGEWPDYHHGGDWGSGSGGGEWPDYHHGGDWGSGSGGGEWPDYHHGGDWGSGSGGGEWPDYHHGGDWGSGSGGGEWPDYHHGGDWGSGSGGGEWPDYHHGGDWGSGSGGGEWPDYHHGGDWGSGSGGGEWPDYHHGGDWGSGSGGGEWPDYHHGGDSGSGSGGGEGPDYHHGGDWGSGSGGGEWPDYHHGGDWGHGSGGGEWPDYHHGGDWGHGTGGGEWPDYHHGGDWESGSGGGELPDYHHGGDGGHGSEDGEWPDNHHGGDWGHGSEDGEWPDNHHGGDWGHGSEDGEWPDNHHGGDWGHGSEDGEWPNNHHGGDWGHGSEVGEWSDYHHGGDWGHGSGGEEWHRGGDWGSGSGHGEWKPGMSGYDYSKWFPGMNNYHQGGASGDGDSYAYDSWENDDWYADFDDSDWFSDYSNDNFDYYYYDYSSHWGNGNNAENICLIQNASVVNVTSCPTDSEHFCVPYNSSTICCKKNHSDTNTIHVQIKKKDNSQQVFNVSDKLSSILNSVTVKETVKNNKTAEPRMLTISLEQSLDLDYIQHYPDHEGLLSVDCHPPTLHGCLLTNGLIDLDKVLVTSNEDITLDVDNIILECADGRSLPTGSVTLVIDADPMQLENHCIVATADINIDSKTVDGTESSKREADAKCFVVPDHYTLGMKGFIAQNGNLFHYNPITDGDSTITPAYDLKHEVMLMKSKLLEEYYKMRIKENGGKCPLTVAPFIPELNPIEGHRIRDSLRMATEYLKNISGDPSEVTNFTKLIDLAPKCSHKSCFYDTLRNMSCPKQQALGYFLLGGYIHEEVNALKAMKKHTSHKKPAKTGTSRLYQDDDKTSTTDDQLIPHPSAETICFTAMIQEYFAKHEKKVHTGGHKEFLKPLKTKHHHHMCDKEALSDIGKRDNNQTTCPEQLPVFYWTEHKGAIYQAMQTSEGYLWQKRAECSCASCNALPLVPEFKPHGKRNHKPHRKEMKWDGHLKRKGSARHKSNRSRKNRTGSNHMKGKGKSKSSNWFEEMFSGFAPKSNIIID